ncbi:hypothetical protein MCEMZLE22_00002 [actinobacterium SCGC AAA044-D11]|uniref:Unannotated protein n=1 Tax=freshwater metagenome TaxID=449393 RepID=A0A6J6AZF6_9ZZZZ
MSDVVVSLGYPRAAHSLGFIVLCGVTRVFDGYPQKLALVTTNTYIK